MGNKQTLKLFIVLALCTSYIFSFSHFGVVAYDTIMNKSDSFDEGTFVGSVNVSGTTKSEALQMVDEQLVSWLNKTEIQVQYKEKKILFDLYSIAFDVQESVDRAIEGQKNNVLVYSDEIEMMLSKISPSNQKVDFDLEKVEEEILGKASMLQTGKYKLRLEEFVLNNGAANDYGTIEATVEAGLSDPVRNMLENIGEVEIAPMSEFSLLAQLEQSGIQYNSAKMLSIMASAIYEVVLQTNFSIIERHISESLPGYAKLGYEAKINPERNIDLVFFNPNDSTYKLQFDWNDHDLVVSLTGTSFLYEYKVVEKEKETFQPKTIVQFNSQLSSGEQSVKTEGKDGLLIRIYRETYDEKGKRIKNERISEDFYAPIHQVEVRSLISSESAADTANDNLRMIRQMRQSR
ncbi:G5 domain-containing protein [Bacillus sp. V3B]|uniref:G5 domain-containing protein n=1 Tax=Bacillus sp. V3B TaxID=2804915 RepID=UPI00210B444E|nr:G5 domain-containing protein [Bacillus sp. V3B]MCQ6273513.1 G5 domain-containing protein [Bacillus sp. V3B]